MSLTPIRVDDWMAWAPGLSNRQDSLLWAGANVASADAKHPAESSLPSQLRRRVSLIGQMAFRAVRGLGEPRPERFIFSSRHGEFGRNLSILRSLAAREQPSPTDFSLSVHNALAGLLSIAQSNPAGHTSIAAGTDSFACALLEAAACLAVVSHEPILLVYFDEPLPEPYSEIADSEDDAIALALRLIAATSQPGDIAIEL
jgi:Beta-ketoacyl synthase, N-terminal domain